MWYCNNVTSRCMSVTVRDAAQSMIHGWGRWGREDQAGEEKWHVCLDFGFCSVDVCLCVFVFTRELQCAIKNREEERENKVECVSRTQVQIHLVPKTIPRLTQSTIIKDHQGFPSCYFLDVCFPALYHHRTIFKSSPFYLHSPISQIMIPQQALQSYMRPSILTASLWVRKSPPLK